MMYLCGFQNCKYRIYNYNIRFQKYKGFWLVALSGVADIL